MRKNHATISFQNWIIILLRCFHVKVTFLWWEKWKVTPHVPVVDKAFWRKHGVHFQSTEYFRQVLLMEYPWYLSTHKKNSPHQVSLTYYLFLFKRGIHKTRQPWFSQLDKALCGDSSHCKTGRAAGTRRKSERSPVKSTLSLSPHSSLHFVQFGHSLHRGNNFSEHGHGARLGLFNVEEHRRAVCSCWTLWT